MLSLVEMGENCRVVQFPLLGVYHSLFAVYSERKGSKSWALVVPKICLPSVLLFSLTKLPIGLGEIIERATDPKVLPKEEALAHRVPACDAGLIGPCPLCAWCRRKLPFPGEVIRTHGFGWRNRDSG